MRMGFYSPGEHRKKPVYDGLELHRWERDTSERRANEGFAPWVLVRGTLSAGPGGSLEVPVDIPSPYVELGIPLSAWNTRQR